jgi:hypothetical protein
MLCIAHATSAHGSGFGCGVPEAVAPRRHSGWTLAIYRIGNMVSHMKTTLNIDGTVMAELKREAARQGRTMSELVETALRLLLRSQRKRRKSPSCGRFAVAAHL